MPFPLQLAQTVGGVTPASLASAVLLMSFAASSTLRRVANPALKSSALKKFSVIHGKGNGVLQQAVHDYLSHAREIRDFMFAPPEDGGTGKTYVELY